jgi:APA family basic amino acid/polyamine antiporter
MTRRDNGQIDLQLGASREGHGSFVRGMSLAGAVALVVGNMVGTSMYTLPASLASEVGPLGILAWVAVAIGYLGVAVVYADLGTRHPRTGGPYVFAREAFGDFGGFLSVWLYWLSLLIGNAGIATGVVAYAQGFFPALGNGPLVPFFVAQVLLWSLCALNVVGIRHSARLQIAIMVINLGGLFLLLGGSVPSIEAVNYHPFAPKGWSSIAVGTALVVWAYGGVETATVPAEEVKHPHQSIWRATMIGYVISTAVFLLVAITVAGVLPNDQVASSARPLALVVEKAIGPTASRIISFCAVVAGLGTLNGWVLVTGRAPVSAAQDGLFFKRMARLHPRFNTPAFALITGTAVASAMLLLILDKSLLGAFNFIVLLSVGAALAPHLITAAAYLALVRRDPRSFTAAQRRRAHVNAPLAFIAMMYFVYGAGADAGRWGFLLLFVGAFAFVFLKASWSSSSPGGEPEKPVIDPLQIEFPISFRVVTVAETKETFPRPE